ncbi:MAG TPA: orotidine-5'-phosphate decarboxylase [Thermoanaerobaculia bacterium]|nr:orotidine-5'-phosphate decarboxylase [Thermoanaerobaculia bacterium]
MTNSTFEEPKHPETGDPYFLSTKTIPPEERLIFALDVPSVEEAQRLVERLGDAVQFYKVGLELLGTGGYFELIEWLAKREKKVFADLKLFDVPATVGAAVRRLRDWPIALTTVHAGSAAILEAASREKGDLKILAVTVLTSLSQEDLRDMGIPRDVREVVLARAAQAVGLGCDGVVASGLEARALREHLGRSPLIVTPGIRPAENRPADDQKRVVTVEQALRNGADYIVVGRPIRDAADPYEAAMQIQGMIEGLFLSA